MITWDVLHVKQPMLAVLVWSLTSNLSIQPITWHYEIKNDLLYKPESTREKGIHSAISTLLPSSTSSWLAKGILTFNNGEYQQQSTGRMRRKQRTNHERWVDNHQIHPTFFCYSPCFLFTYGLCIRIKQLHGGTNIFREKKIHVKKEEKCCSHRACFLHCSVCNSLDHSNVIRWEKKFVDSGHRNGSVLKSKKRWEQPFSRCWLLNRISSHSRCPLCMDQSKLPTIQGNEIFIILFLKNKNKP